MNQQTEQQRILSMTPAEFAKYEKQKTKESLVDLKDRISQWIQIKNIIAGYEAEVKKAEAVEKDLRSEICADMKLLGIKSIPLENDTTLSKRVTPYHKLREGEEYYDKCQTFIKNALALGHVNEKDVREVFKINNKALKEMVKKSPDFVKDYTGEDGAIYSWDREVLMLMKKKDKGLL